MRHAGCCTRSWSSRFPSARLRLLLAGGVLAVGLFACGGDSGAPGEGRTVSVVAELSLAERMARYAQIRDAAATRGIDHTAYLLAGIAYAETGLAHCWSEATWACQGPNSPDCGGGPVIAGAGDGACSLQQGGLGMFQFDAGTFTDTLNTYGADVLTVAGNTSHAIDYVVHMVKISAYTTNAETDAKALQWLNDFDLGNGTLRDQWIKTVTHYYNGCLPSYSCWTQRYNHYNDSLQTVVDETGLPFWVVAPPDKPPTGYLDHAGCDGIRGWAQDPDTPDASLDVHLYFDSVPGDANPTTIVLHADQDRQDLCAALGSCNHGYEVDVPRSLLDGAQHTVHAYGINSASGGANPELLQSPGTFQCDPPAAPVDAAHGVRRWVTGPDAFASWKFSSFYDVAHLSDAELQAWPQGEDWPASPQLAQADDGSPEVWSIDGSLRRHVLSPADLSAWRFDAAAIEKWPAAQVSSYEQGASWVSIPFLAQGSGPEVYVIDSAVAPGADSDAGVVGASDAGLGDAGAWPGSPDGGGQGAGPSYASMGDTAGVGPCSLSPWRRAGHAGWLVTVGAGLLWSLRRRRTA